MCFLVHFLFCCLRNGCWSGSLFEMDVVSFDAVGYVLFDISNPFFVSFEERPDELDGSKFDRHFLSKPFLWFVEIDKNYLCPSWHCFGELLSRCVVDVFGQLLYRVVIDHCLSLFVDPDEDRCIRTVCMTEITNDAIFDRYDTLIRFVRLRVFCWFLIWSHRVA